MKKRGALIRNVNSLRTNSFFHILKRSEKSFSFAKLDDLDSLKLNPLLNKKSQITIFIIIGIMILLLFALFAYIQRELVAGEPGMSLGITPVHDYVTQAMDATLEEAVYNMGLQGGYLNVPDYIVLEKSYMPVGSEEVVKIPYWFYHGEERIPSISSMEQELEEYVSDNLLENLDFSEFEDQYDIRIISNLSADVSINNEDVTADMHLEIETTEKNTGDINFVEDYFIKQDVKLKKAYDLANDVIDSEAQDLFLENLTIDLMTAHPDIPFTNLDFSCKKKQWLLSDIRDETQRMIFAVTPRIRIKNTYYMPFEAPIQKYEALRQYTMEDMHNKNLPSEVPSDAYDYFNLLWQVSDKSYQDLEAEIYYDNDFGISMYARPSENGVLYSNVQEGAFFLNFICIQVYHFTYDVQYPVVIRIWDKNAYGGEGFLFQIATPVIIDHNQGNRSLVSEQMIDVTDARFQSIDAEKYCSQTDGRDVLVKTVSFDVSTGTNKPVGEVGVSYECLTFTCDYGLTSTNGELTVQLPASCANGFFTAEKEGYVNEIMQYNDLSKFTLEIKKQKEFEVGVDKFRDASPSSAIGLAEHETAYVTLNNAALGVNDVTEFDRDQPGYVNLVIDDEPVTYSASVFIVNEQTGNTTYMYMDEWTPDMTKLFTNNKIRFHTVSPDYIFTLTQEQKTALKPTIG